MVSKNRKSATNLFVYSIWYIIYFVESLDWVKESANTCSVVESQLCLLVVIFFILYLICYFFYLPINPLIIVINIKEFTKWWVLHLFHLFHHKLTPDELTHSFITYLLWPPHLHWFNPGFSFRSMIVSSDFIILLTSPQALIITYPYLSSAAKHWLNKHLSKPIIGTMWNMFVLPKVIEAT